METSSLLLSHPPITNTERSGSIWTALAHITTAVIGSGVLSLAWSMSQLGWIAGPITMLIFALTSLTSAFLLCNCYMSSDLSDGRLHRNVSFLDAVSTILGKKNGWICGVIVHINFVKAGIVYTITASISMRAIQRSNCYHIEGHAAACEYETSYYILLFGFVQVVVSQIPDFQNTIWLSITAATMSIAYSTIGSALGLIKIIENGEVEGSTGGTSSAEKVWLVAQAIGDIAYAFPFSLLFLEIMDTLKSNPPETVIMKKASVAAACATTFFYMSCAGLGYAAFGSSTPGNILTGFGFYEPYWLVDFANVCVVVHLVGGYQLFTQPLYTSIEGWLGKKFPGNNRVRRLWALRLCYRTVYVGLITGIAMTFPYFNEVLGVLGAVMFWPVVVYFPVEMYMVQKNVGVWTVKGMVLRTSSLVSLVAMAFAFVGSLKGVITARFR